jgi:hypothetical protein
VPQEVMQGMLAQKILPLARLARLIQHLARGLRARLDPELTGTSQAWVVRSTCVRHGPMRG